MVAKLYRSFVNFGYGCLSTAKCIYGHFDKKAQWKKTGSRTKEDSIRFETRFCTSLVISMRLQFI